MTISAGVTERSVDRPRAVDAVETGDDAWCARGVDDAAMLLLRHRAIDAVHRSADKPHYVKLPFPSPCWSDVAPFRSDSPPTSWSKIIVTAGPPLRRTPQGPGRAPNGPHSV